MKSPFSKIQSHIAILQYNAIHPNVIYNTALTHIVSPLVHYIFNNVKVTTIIFTPTCLVWTHYISIFH